LRDGAAVVFVPGGQKAGRYQAIDQVAINLDRDHHNVTAPAIAPSALPLRRCN
jgi:hypothetical protein